MKRLLVFLLVFVFTVMFIANEANADIWARGVSQASGWFDAEKDSVDTDDDLLCWAASAANILKWSGWDAGYANEDDIFDFMNDNTHDAGGWQSWAWEWWFDGTQGSHFGGSSHTGFYTTAEYNAAYDYEWDNADLDVALDIAADWLENDYGVGIAVKDGCYHAVTLWGIDTCETTGDYLGVWITDSDNNKGGPDPRPNTLDYYDVFYGADDLWHLDGMCGDAAIIEMDALAYVPVPGAVLLGLLGLGTAGLKLRKRA